MPKPRYKSSVKCCILSPYFDSNGQVASSHSITYTPIWPEAAREPALYRRQPTERFPVALVCKSSAVVKLGRNGRDHLPNKARWPSDVLRDVTTDVDSAQNTRLASRAPRSVEET